MIGSCAVISNSAAARLQKSKIEIKRKIVRVDRPNPLLMVTFSQTPQFQDDSPKASSRCGIMLICCISSQLK